MTIIVADTTCGLPRELLAQRGISVIPQVVIFGEDSFHDDKKAESLVAELMSRVSVPNIPIYELPPAIVVHVGPRAMGVGFFA